MTPTRWFVAFYDPHGGRGWWWWLTKPGFRHCCAFGFVHARNCWLAADWSGPGLELLAMSGQEVDELLVAICASGGTILEVERPAEFPPRLRLPRLPVYCVTLVKHLLGIRSWALTPWQLFCALQKSGARESFIATRNVVRARIGR